MSKRSDAKHTEEGLEITDPTPMQPPLGYKKTIPLHQQILQQVRIQKLRDAELDETEDEADDFEVGDDFEPLSPHENDHMPTLANLKKQAAKINKEIEEAKRKKAISEYEKQNTKAKKETAPQAPTEEADTRSPTE